MKMIAFAVRNLKEIIRDKTNLFFGIGFPVVLLLLLSAIQANIPVDMFMIDSLAPGMAVFGLSFISLFSGMLIAKDRTSSFMLRMFTSPMKARDFIFGYTLPLLPVAMAQAIVTFITALCLGMKLSANILTALVALLPSAVLYIAIGLLAGSVLTDKQVGGVCGALLTNLSAWLSGIWFDLNLVGGAFKTVAECLPFCHAVRAAQAAMAGGAVFPDLWWVIGYAAVLTALAVFAFMRQMNGDHQ